MGTSATTAKRQRTALVTGASRGIGLATVEALEDAGWRVVAAVRDLAAMQPDALSAVETVQIDFPPGVSQ